MRKYFATFYIAIGFIMAVGSLFRTSHVDNGIILASIFLVGGVNLHYNNSSKKDKS